MKMKHVILTALVWAGFISTTTASESQNAVIDVTIKVPDVLVFYHITAININLAPAFAKTDVGKQFPLGGDTTEVAADIVTPASSTSFAVTINKAWAVRTSTNANDLTVTASTAGDSAVEGTVDLYAPDETSDNFDSSGKSGKVVVSEIKVYKGDDSSSSSVATVTYDKTAASSELIGSFTNALQGGLKFTVSLIGVSAAKEFTSADNTGVFLTVSQIQE